MTKTNPDTVIRFATELLWIDRIDRKAFNAAMRTKFPNITPRMLHNVYQDAKILLAIQFVTRQRKL